MSVRAVFAVEFHALKGNNLVFQQPAGLESLLSGIEFRAMPSGSHVVAHDYSYYRLGPNAFGLSCFKTVKDPTSPRGLRARAVGVVMTSPDMLANYREFLDQQCGLQLQSPGNEDYGPLELLLTQQNQFDNAQALTAQRRLQVRLPVWADSSTSGLTIEEEQTAELPPGSLSGLLQRHGRRIMILWKLMLLQKRVIFLGPPPVDDICQRVLACCALGSKTLPEDEGEALPLPLGYTSLSEIPRLDSEESFVCCVTETIFESKRDLYDVFVKDGKLLAGNESTVPLLRLTPADNRRFAKLQRLLKDNGLQKSDEGRVTAEEETVLRYFVEMNNRIFSALQTVRRRSSRMVTREDAQHVGLDVRDDLPLLLGLATLYCPDVDVAQMTTCGCV